MLNTKNKSRNNIEMAKKIKRIFTEFLDLKKYHLEIRTYNTNQIIFRVLRRQKSMNDMACPS
jgi:hypothetical protein